MKVLITILLFSFLQFSCRKKDDTAREFTLPAKTQSGQHTFGFLLNSSVWTNYGQHCTFYGCEENLDGVYYSSDGDIRVDADRVLYKGGTRDTDESFGFTLSTNFRGAGTYSTMANDTISVGYTFSEPGQPDKYYILPQTNRAFSITITKIDTLNKILAGEFYGKLFRRTYLSSYATSTTDSINITDGRFDIKLR